MLKSARIESPYYGSRTRSGNYIRLYTLLLQSLYGTKMGKTFRPSSAQCKPYAIRNNLRDILFFLFYYLIFHVVSIFIDLTKIKKSFEDYSIFPNFFRSFKLNTKNIHHL